MRRQGAKLEERERECGEREREAEDARRWAREAEDRVSQLEPRVRAAEREAKVSPRRCNVDHCPPSPCGVSQDLRRQLREVQTQAEGEAANRARDLSVSEGDHCVCMYESLAACQQDTSSTEMSCHVQDVEGRLREAEERLGRSHPEMAAKQREIEVRRGGEGRGGS